VAAVAPVATTKAGPVVKGEVLEDKTGRFVPVDEVVRLKSKYVYGRAVTVSDPSQGGRELLSLAQEKRKCFLSG
jgi:hypothetical protein